MTLSDAASNAALKSAHRLLPLLLASCLLLSACRALSAPTPAAGTLPDNAQPEAARIVYVLSGRGQYNGYRNNALTLVDADTWQVIRRVPLPRSLAHSFARDPQGRIWIGFSGGIGRSDNRVQVYDAGGDLIATLTPCLNPEAGIVFAAERAFVVCATNGFAGVAAVLDLASLESLGQVELTTPEPPYLLIASAADAETVIVSGLSSGAGTGPHSTVTLIDPETLTVTEQIGPLSTTDVWQILPASGQFYLLNVGSLYEEREVAPDLLIVAAESGAAPEPRQLAAASPLWGAIEEETLWAFHNPSWNQPNQRPERAVSRLELASGESRLWPLPDRWSADGLAVIDGNLILSNWWPDDGERDGLYRFDPATGELTQLAAVLGAEKMIGP